MKFGFFVLAFLLFMQAVSAQLTITAGSQFSITGNTQLTLQNTNLVNNGNFQTGNSKVTFSGNAASSIGGSQPVKFYDLEMNKNNGASVLLQRAVGIQQRILFTSGFLNLNRFDVDLGTTALLDGEKEGSRITGSNGGQVLFNTILNTPASANPGNLGAIITSSENLGSVIIKRGHQSQVNGFGIGSSVLRYYDISPATNTGLNATLRFHYFDGELNGIPENSMVFFKSDNGNNWFVQGFTSRNTTSNFVEKIGINSFSLWTLSGPNNTLPVHFTLFNVRCEGSKVVIHWKTAQEQNSSHFNIERSNDGSTWTVIGNLPAAGNTGNERSYSFTDNSPAPNSYYRIAEYDIDGRIQYTSVLRSSCTVTDVFKVWPNPFHEDVFVNIVTNSASTAVIKVFDSKGALVKTHKATLLPGSNQFKVNIGSLANGVYSLSADWDNGKMKKAIQVLKQ